MSKKRQTDPKTEKRRDALVRTYAVRHSHAQAIPAHTHDWHQLIYAGEGVMWVQTAQGEWVVPPNRAVWVPAGIEHSIEMSGRVFIQTLYLSTEVPGDLPTRCSAVNVSPLLRELIVHLVSKGAVDDQEPKDARLIGFLIDQLQELPTIPLQLPLPTDERALRAVAWMREHPDDSSPLKQMARRVSVSVRTLERLFQTETGLTFGKWRQQLRLLHALRHLAGGRPVTSIALEVGYDSPSAFIAAFRQHFGATPSRYFE
jgi:AraC-like DNA-binding protein/mannose-6-phosphate isomerase-like protein (cupin superfamily)